MSEVADAREQTGHAALLAELKRLLVASRAAGMHEARDAGVDQRLVDFDLFGGEGLGFGQCFGSPGLGQVETVADDICRRLGFEDLDAPFFDIFDKLLLQTREIVDEEEKRMISIVAVIARELRI